MRKVPITLMLFLASMTTSAHAPADCFIDSLIQQMTVAEKIGQLNQLHCENWERLREFTAAGKVGSVMSITDPVKFNEIQLVAVEQSRLGIPLINARDVIHGFKTIFPIPLGQGASFNPLLIEKCASIAATEATAAGIRWTFAPMVDISHDPRWGRIAEGFGEDPYLTSVLGASMVKGFQGSDLSNSQSMAACAKHFAAYGAAEGGRDYNSTFVSENRLRNLYLRPFKACVEQGVATIMTSFNDNDGIPSSGNKWLLKDVLRDEWGFDGVVVSDWSSISEMIKHGFCSNREEAALRAFNAGLDIDMVSDVYTDCIDSLLSDNKISMEALDASVRNVLMLKYKLGLFAEPYCNPDSYSKIGCPEHLQTAQNMAEESLVLLKNHNSILPFDLKGKKVLITGPLANAPKEQLGTWVFDGDSSLSITPLEALKNYIGEENVLFHPLLSHSRDRSDISSDILSELAKKADVIIAVIGEEAILSGEAHCLSDLKLQGQQSELIEKLSETGKPFISIVIAGRPLDIKNEVDFSDALIYSFAPGSMGGPAIINTIIGNNNPSGKLPITFPVTVGQIPMYYNHNNTGRPAEGNEIYLNDIPVGAEQTALGNKSYYLDGNTPLFRFGDGLSYTNFSYSDLKTDKKEYSKSDSINIEFKLMNSGEYDGKEVIQIYIRDIASSVIRPVLELVHFDKVALSAGESMVYDVKIPVKTLSYWNGSGWCVEPGEFEFYVGGNSHDLIKTNIKIK